MTITPGELLAAASILIVLLVHTGALFRWSGEVKGMLHELKTNDAKHEAEILRLRDWKHDELAPWASKIEARVAVIEDRHDREG